MNALKRQTPAKGVHVKPDQLTILWVTVWSRDRSEWLVQEPVIRIPHSIWLNEAKGWLVGDYLRMPDRVHFFCGCEIHALRSSIGWRIGKIALPRATPREHGHGKEASFIIASDRFRSIVRSGST